MSVAPLAPATPPNARAGFGRADADAVGDRDRRGLAGADIGDRAIGLPRISRITRRAAEQRIAARILCVHHAEQVGDDRLDILEDRGAALGRHGVAVRLDRERLGALKLRLDRVECALGIGEQRLRGLDVDVVGAVVRRGALEPGELLPAARAVRRREDLRSGRDLSLQRVGLLVEAGHQQRRALEALGGGHTHRRHRMLNSVSSVSRAT
jgi:hypothetical protein